MKLKRNRIEDEINIKAAVEALEESGSAVSVVAVAELSDIPKQFIYRYVEQKTFPICSRITIRSNGKKGYSKYNKPKAKIGTNIDSELEKVAKNLPAFKEDFQGFPTKPAPISAYTNFLEEAFATGKTFKFDDLIDEASEVIDGYRKSGFEQAFHKLEAEKHIKRASPTSDLYITAYEHHPSYKDHRQLEIFNCDGELLVYSQAEELPSSEVMDEMQQHIFDTHDFSDMKTQDSALIRVQSIIDEKAETEKQGQIFGDSEEEDDSYLEPVRLSIPIVNESNATFDLYKFEGKQLTEGDIAMIRSYSTYLISQSVTEVDSAWLALSQGIELVMSFKAPTVEHMQRAFEFFIQYITWFQKQEEKQ